MSATGKFKVGDRVTTNDTANVDIIQHWNDWFRGEHGEIVDGALVVASVSDKHIGLSNRAGAAHFYMPPSTLTIAPLTIRAADTIIAAAVAIWIGAWLSAIFIIPFAIIWWVLG